MAADEFADTVMKLVQEFGLLAQDKTPCGENTSVSEAHALTVLNREEPLSQQSLADRLQLEKSTVSRLTDAMERKGWITRSRSASDRRRKDLSLSEEGNERAREINRARKDYLERVLDRVPESKRETIQDSMRLLLEALAEVRNGDSEGLDQ